MGDATFMSANTLILGSGFVSYLIYKRYEPSGVSSSLLLLVLLPGTVATTVHGQFANTLTTLAVVYSEYWLTLIFLVVGYRLSPWHPLAAFPGPVLCKISKFWLAYKVRQGRAHRYHLELHAQYGDVVRTGPNEVSIRHEGAISPILRDSPKGPYYLTRNHGPIAQLDGIFEPNEYARRRRAWNRGTSMAAVKNYEELLRSVIRDATTALEQRRDEPLDLASWMIFIAFDFMGEMALSKQFHNVQAGRDTSGIIHAIEEGVMQLAWVAHVPWILPTLALVGNVFGEGKSWKALQTIGEEIVHSRITNGSERRDLFHYLMDGDNLEEVKSSIGEIASDGILAIIAGSDTSATALSQTFYFLLKHPIYMKRLREEIAVQYPGTTDTTLDFSKQAEMPYLNACINEAMRLYPSVTTGLQRTINTGTGGNMLGPYFVPDGTQASVNLFSMQRDPRYFYPLPEQFWPDRWLNQEAYELPSGQVISKHDLVHKRDVFVPFSMGSRSCAGKSVATLEMRAVLCALVQKFDISKAASYNLDDWERAMRDIFIVSCGPLMVEFHPRY